VRPERTAAALLAATLVVTACAGSAAPNAGETPAPVAQSPAPNEPQATPAPTPPPFWPLTGMPLDGDATLRPLAVRFDNATPAQPQAGLANADIVFDTVIEACVSRLLAIYHSKGASPLGSIRSARLYDLQLLPLFRGALAHVGAANEVSAMLKDASKRGEFVDIDAASFGPDPGFSRFYWRIGHKAAPYNMYTSTESLRNAAATAPRGADRVNVPAPWAFLPPQGSEPLAGGFANSAPAAAFRLPGASGNCPQGQSIPGYRAEYAPTYTYDDAAHGYRRAAGGRPTIDETTKQAVVARNVVVVYSDLQVTNIVESQGGWGVAYSILPRTTGEGRVAIYRNGRRAEGTWSRADNAAAFTFRTASGDPILLAPGQTWVHIVPTYWQLQ